MAILPFLKKKEEKIPEKGFPPTERVKELAARGFSESEIINVLRREGYSPQEIDSALSQAISSAIAPKSEKKEEKLLPTYAEIKKEEEKKGPEIPETSLPEYYYSYPSEEYIDAIIEARMSELNEKIVEIGARYNELERRLEAIDEKINKLASARSEEQAQILQKIELFKESFEELNTRIGAIEKAFKETLPALIESVRALSDLVQKLKS